MSPLPAIGVVINIEENVTAPLSLYFTWQELTDIDEMNSYYRLNLFSVICLNSVFQAMFPRSRMVFINVSSILALQPLTTWGNYCGGKAARSVSISSRMVSFIDVDLLTCTQL